MSDNTIETFAQELGETTSTGTRLEIPVRNKIQIALMILMLGDHPSSDTQLEWAVEYRSVVSNIIDDPKNELIRTTAQNMAKIIEERELAGGAKGSFTDYASVAQLIYNHPLTQAKIHSEFKNAA